MQPNGARLRHRGACKRPVSCSFLPLRHEGGGAPQGANLMVSAPIAGHGGRLPARHSGVLFGIGPRFRLALPRSKRTRGQVVRQLLPGAGLAPGGAPIRPGCPDANRTRGRRTPPHVTTPHERAPRWTRQASLTARGKAGIDTGIGPLKFTRHPRAYPGGPIGR